MEIMNEKMKHSRKFAVAIFVVLTLAVGPAFAAEKVKKERRTYESQHHL
jgi:hypothetical protein